VPAGEPADERADARGHARADPRASARASARADPHADAAAAHALRLSAAHVGELVGELAPLVRGLLVREVLPAPPRDLLLVLGRGADGPPDWRILVSAGGDAPRFHAQRGRFERHDGPVGPFFRDVERELAGARVESLTQIGGDRIVALACRRESGEPRTLVAELVGRHANLALLGRADQVLAVLVPAPRDKANPRLVPGAPYAPPPGRPAGAGGPDLRAALPAPVAPAPLARGETTDRAPLSWIVELALGSAAARARHEDLARDLVARLERKRKNAGSLLAGLEKRRAAADEAERVRQDGELVKANLGRLARGARELVTEDLYDPQMRPRRVALDPKLSPIENLERLFDKAKKLARSRDAVAGEIALTAARVAELDGLLARARAPDADLAQVEAAALERGLLDPRQTTVDGRPEKPAPRLPYRSFAGYAGSEIRVGRSARDNDELTFRHARGNDLWLHTADTPGSHVVLPLEKGAEPHHEELLDAAHLAVHHSPIAGATRARVHVARRKEVHKPRGAKPGLVTLSGGRILELRMQPERLQRLLRAHRPPPGEGA
jgi:predicted ribosome quality control (RQC) complex YloA/Tae2 family protein